jgi:hypothetical protein
MTPEKMANVGHPPPIGAPTNDPNFDLRLCSQRLAEGHPGVPCTCDDYNIQYPPPMSLDTTTSTEVINTEATRTCHNFGEPNTCVDGQPLVGCTNDLFDGEAVFAWPDCAAIGQVSGRVFKQGAFSADGLFDGNDDDFTFHVCPESMSVRLPNDTWMTKDLRDIGSFYGFPQHNVVGDQPAGRIHVEVQGCRFFSGDYQIKDADGITRSYPSRPQPNDLITAAGDWVFDRFHEINEGAGWAEIHEARIVTAARPAPAPTDGSVNYVFVSSAFIQGSAQQDDLEIMAAVPKPADVPGSPKKWFLTSCEKDPPAFVMSGPRCPGLPKQKVKVTANPKNGTCLVQIDHHNLDLADIQKRFDGYNCQDECGGTDFHENPIDLGQDSNGQEIIIPSSCDRIAYAGVIRATWTLQDPQTFSTQSALTSSSTGVADGDLWMCDSCACSDPASPGGDLTMPVVGCAQTGLDPSSAADQRAACQQVCGDQVCGPQQSCFTGACRPPAAASPAAAHLVGTNSCTPGAPPDSLRVTDASNYHVTMTPFNGSTGSFAIFDVGDSHSGKVPIHGTTALNLLQRFDNRANQMVSRLDVANLQLTPDNFSVGGKSVTAANIFVGQRLWATFTGATTFSFAPQSVVLGLRGFFNGTRVGLNQQNPTASSGSFDLSTGKFTLDVVAEDVDQGDQRKMTAHLEGTIDNSPPTAIISGGGPPVECASVRSLSGSTSTDPDSGDSISSFQWFADGEPRGSSSSIPLTTKPTGTTTYALNVYDQRRGSSSASLKVEVIDTTGPRFTFVPPNLTVNTCKPTSIGGDATAVDDCQTAVPTVDSNKPAFFPPATTTTVTYSTKDSLNNPSTATQLVTVDDKTAPEFKTVPGPITVGSCGPVPLNGPATATDDCGTVPTVTNDGPASFGPGTTTVTWTAKDPAGNKNTATQTVTVIDVTPPTFSFVPGPVESSHCTIAGGLNIGTATATDNCSVTVTSNAPAKFPLGVTTVTWKATDSSGNVTTATQKVTITLDDDPSCCPAGTKVILGTSGADNIVGTISNECILGLGGNDVIEGGGGLDFIAGGSGDDNLKGGASRDYIWGGAGRDTIDGAEGDDFIDGGADTDTCNGSAGTNSLLRCESKSFCTASCCGGNTCTMPPPAALGCQPAYVQSSCGSYVKGVVISRNGHNWECTGAICTSCINDSRCAPAGSGCPSGVIWTDRGGCP